MTRLIDPERYRNARELVELASSLDIDEIFEAAGRPYPARALANSVTPLVVNIANQAGIGGKDLRYTTEDGNISQILWHGIDDTQSALVPQILLQPKLEDAVGFVNHPRTAQALASIALYSEETMSGLIQQMNSSIDSTTAAEPHLIVHTPSWLAKPKGGCPAAKHKNIESIKPVWSDFVQWVGHLAIRSIVHHQDRVKPAFSQSTQNEEQLTEIQNQELAS